MVVSSRVTAAVSGVICGANSTNYPIDEFCSDRSRVAWSESRPVGRYKQNESMG